jgi:quercetin dioxygenase-like cupin family protein
MRVSYSFVDAEDVPLTWGTFRFVRHALGATAFGFSQVDFPPDKVGAEHDERESGQEEVYTALHGSGVVRVDGEDLPLRPGLYVLVSADSTRQVVAGHEGLGYLVVGAIVAGGLPAAEGAA